MAPKNNKKEVGLEKIDSFLEKEAELKEKLDISRRGFFKNVGLATLASTALITLIPTSAEAEVPAISFGGVEEIKSENYIIRMMSELKRALAKPASERNWGMVIDLRKCIGCHACTVGCAIENGLPPGIMYRPVYDEIKGTYPNLTRQFLPRPCMQCDKPACIPACPNSAIVRREDGINAIDYDKCVGAKDCITACPYDAITFDEGKFFNEIHQPYEDKSVFEYKKNRSRKDGKTPVDVARKCHFCIHRIENGQLPMCTTTCIGHATFFGDWNDKNSLISELKAKNKGMIYKEEAGTNPKVLYLI